MSCSQNHGTVVLRHGLEQVSDVGRMQRAQPHVELDQILPPLHLFEQRAARRLLAAGDALEEAVPGDQLLDLGNLLFQPDVG